jgi:hypothetical protein
MTTFTFFFFPQTDGHSEGEVERGLQQARGGESRRAGGGAGGLGEAEAGQPQGNCSPGKGPVRLRTNSCRG